MSGSVLTRIKRFFFSISLQAKIIGMVIGLSVFMGTILSLQVSRFLNDNMYAFLAKESRSVANEIAYKVSDYTLINDLYGLTRYLSNAKTNRRDVRYLVVFDRRGNIIAHTFGSHFPTELGNHLRRVYRYQEGVKVIKTNEGLIWETVRPVLRGWNGSIAVGVQDYFVRQDNREFIRSLLLTTLLVAMAGIFFAVLLSLLIAKPIKELLAATNAVRQGKYTVVIEPVSRDEVGALTLAFNEMSSGFQMADEARKEKENIRREFLQKIISSQENERKRIARELHDQTGQSLASLSIGLNLLQRMAGSEEMRQNIHLLKENIENELEAIHNMALELRPSVLDDMGLIAALSLYVDDVGKANKMEIRQNIIGFQDRRPAPSIETCLYRIVQEAIHNAVRHGQAQHISLFLEWRTDTIRLLIDDDGKGFDLKIMETTTRLGIHGMRERVELADGSFRIESEPGQGVMIVVTVPSHTGDEHEG